VVAPPVITRSTVRGIESGVELGPDDGMSVECAVSFDNLRTLAAATGC
jgi:mRNA-degrading endonuclease toxin of MazEF toxin-antitoxin module